MEAMAERTTLLLPRFPVSLRLRVKAKAVGEARYLTDVFVELLEKALAADEAEQQKRREGKRHE